MAEFNGIISNFANDVDISFDWTITTVPALSTIASAEFTVKTVETDPDSAAILVKIITPTNSTGVGQVEDTGSDGTGKIRFDLTPTDTAKLTPGVIYVYWVYVILNSGQTTLVEKGSIFSAQGASHV